MTGGDWVNPVETTLLLLKQLQNDYRNAKEELHSVSLRFGEKEMLADWQLHMVIEKINASKEASNIVSFNQTLSEKAVHLGRKSLERVEKQSRPILYVQCLGTFQIQVNGNTIECWRSTKAKSLLKYMVTQRGGPVSREILMEALWPGFDPLLANNNLKTTMKLLRQTLGSTYERKEKFSWIIYQNGNYSIHKEIDILLDVDQFEYHWHTGKRLENEHKLDEAITHYQAAKVLYKGDYLLDDLYEDWTLLRREAIKDIYLSILNKLAYYSIQETNYVDCIDYCQNILAKDPCREDAYRYLMCCYSRLGQRNRAIYWYRLAEKNIRNELNISPDKETRALYDKLVRGSEDI